MTRIDICDDYRITRERSGFEPADHAVQHGCVERVVKVSQQRPFRRLERSSIAKNDLGRVSGAAFHYEAADIIVCDST